jgi:hypothetical protein
LLEKFRINTIKAASFFKSAQEQIQTGMIGPYTKGEAHLQTRVRNADDTVFKKASFFKSASILTFLTFCA